MVYVDSSSDDKECFALWCKLTNISISKWTKREASEQTDEPLASEKITREGDIHTGNSKGFILKVFIKAFTSTEGTWRNNDQTQNNIILSQTKINRSMQQACFTHLRFILKISSRCVRTLAYSIVCLCIIRFWVNSNKSSSNKEIGSLVSISSKFWMDFIQFIDTIEHKRVACSGQLTLSLSIAIQASISIYFLSPLPKTGL